VDVADDDLAGRADARLQQGGDVAGAAGKVEHSIAALHATGADEIAFPQAMDAERHQVVHQVVAAGYRAEHAADQLLLVADGHVAEAEVGGVGGRPLLVVIAHAAIIPWVRHSSSTPGGTLEAFSRRSRGNGNPMALLSRAFVRLRRPSSFSLLVQRKPNQKKGHPAFAPASRVREPESGFSTIHP